MCIYVLLGLSFAFLFEAIGDLGSQPFFATREREMRSDYVYFSFITMATVEFGDLTVGFSEHDPHCMMHVCDLDERLA